MRQGKARRGGIRQQSRLSSFALLDTHHQCALLMRIHSGHKLRSVPPGGRRHDPDR